MKTTMKTAMKAKYEAMEAEMKAEYQMNLDIFTSIEKCLYEDKFKFEGRVEEWYNELEADLNEMWDFMVNEFGIIMKSASQVKEELKQAFEQ